MLKLLLLRLNASKEKKKLRPRDSRPSKLPRRKKPSVKLLLKKQPPPRNKLN